jgi:hypothetical protein
MLVQYGLHCWTPSLNGGEHVLDVRAAHTEDVADAYLVERLGNEVSDDHGWVHA